jgi:hypothetical protein
MTLDAYKDPPDRSKTIAAQLLCLAALSILATSASAQDLTPRAYWPTPQGTKLFVAGYAHQQGDVIMDPSLPVTGVDSNIDSFLLAYQQSLSLFGRSSTFQFEVPYADVTTTGMLPTGRTRRDVTGIGDVAALLSINLIGAPTMDLEGYQAFRESPRAILGASVKIVAPTGQYDADRLINIGTNRWAVRARLGYAQPLRDTRWVLELAVGTWFFEDNDEFLGERRKQDPVTAIDFSVIRRFRPGFWGSLDFNYYLGGRSTFIGEKGEDFQRNSRYGFTVAFPIKGRHAIKASFSNGITVQSGDDYQTFAVSYIYRIN